MPVKEQNVALRRFFRIVVVLLTWTIVSIMPDSPTSFYQTVIIASITAAYEYTILLLDAVGKIKKALSYIGLFGCVIYFSLAFLGFGGLLVLDLSTKQFWFTDRFPLSKFTGTWSFFNMVLPMYVFPLLVIIEPFLIKAVDIFTPNKSPEATKQQGA